MVVVLPRTLDVLFKPIGGEGAKLGESPFWDHGDNIWWVDIDGRKLMRTGLSTRETRAWSTPETPGFVVLAGPERPVVGMESGIFSFSPAHESFELLVPFDADGERFNDATVDDNGHLWVSSMAVDALPGRGALHVVTSDLTLRTVLTGLTTPNGFAADARGGRLFFSDSHPNVRAIWTVVCDFMTCEIGARTEFASMQRMTGRPDGAALAASGEHYWIAGVDGGALYGFSMGGTMEFTVPLAFPAPTKLVHFANGVAVTAKGVGGYDGRLAIATEIPPDLRCSTVPFWRPADRFPALQ